MKKYYKTIMLVLVVCCGGLMINAVQDAPTDENLEVKIVNDYNIYALPLPDEMSFAGEAVPLDDPDIRERMDRELLVNTYWQSNGLLIMKRAERYFPVIEPLLKKYGLPDDFKYLAVAESALQNNRSPAGAAGFWHFLKSTGREYGLEINDYVDERYNLELSTKVAAEYLKKSKERFGSWTLAAAAYNAGNAGISKQQKRQDAFGSYYDLLLNDETSRYLFRILAFKEIMSNPKKYGFNFRDQDLYQPIPTYEVVIDTAITDMPAFAKKFNINYKILKLHNPWLRDTYLKNASRKKYTITIPKEGVYSMGQ
ncbi:lytic transglycosylase domain-containing protein [Gilvibacter sp.]|uniref:lytic transglycosylase domain-containing protein n=1 Tax=Gilvibacter sp. TaxID=2729997 RepID=UPI003F49E6D6